MELLARVPDGIYIPTKVLAKFHGVPKEYLSKALQCLAAAELIEGTLGPRGGYRIARSPSKISLLDIVEAIEGTKKSFNCQEIRFNNPCLKKEHKDRSTTCTIAKAMYQADEAWRAVLRKTKLSDIISGINNEVPSIIFELSEEWIQNELS
ncbi:transcriptional regulator [Bacteriovorax sp. BSW11_IV]|nr:transcriptional regulator [Bacteriovorax sp. BSW11_IV]